MTDGCVSDIDGDDSVMDSPDVTVSIDLSTLPPEQALQIAQQAGFEQFDPEIVGFLVQGKEIHRGSAEFHLPLGPGLTALSELDVIDIPEEPPEDVNEVENNE